MPKQIAETAHQTENVILWVRGDYAGPLAGEGILVVHNPAFDPLRHEASRRALEEGVFVEGYDPAYSHLEPARQPARLEVNRFALAAVRRILPGEYALLIGET